MAFGRYKVGDTVTGYTLDKFVAAGRYGMVFRASRDGVEVALKLPRHFEEAESSLGAEERRLREFQGCEHIVALAGSALDAHGNRALALEWMAGGDMHAKLKALRRAGKHFDGGELRGFGNQLVAGLAFIHSKGFSHADIKPDNLLLDATGTRVRYCDVGHADRLRKGQMAHRPVVTPGYDAPELLLARRPYTTAIDVWALASTLFELATRTPLIDMHDGADDKPGDKAGDKTDDKTDKPGDKTPGSDEASSDDSDDDSWETEDSDLDSDSSEEDVGETLLQLGRMHALFGVKFVPLNVKRRQHAFYNSHGALRGDKRFRFARKGVAERLVAESGLSDLDVGPFSQLLAKAFVFACADRATCAQLAEAEWLKRTSSPC